MRELALPEIYLPVNMLILYEKIIIDRDRSGNWRFYFGKDGAFFNARNKQLWVAPEHLQLDTLNLFWNIPFAEEPTQQLSAIQVTQLYQAIDRAAIKKLKPYYVDSDFERTLPPWIERWTFVKEAKIYTITIECQATPFQLVQLKKELEQLLVAASVQNLS